MSTRARLAALLAGDGDQCNGKDNARPHCALLPAEIYISAGPSGCHFASRPGRPSGRTTRGGRHAFLEV
jgi:hypothetical protein